MKKNILKLAPHKLILTILLYYFISISSFGQTITPIKTVIQNPNSCNLIDVQLQIQGSNPISRPLEVVLVIDVSGSMGYTISGDTQTSMDYAKDAAEEFVNNVLTLNNPTGMNKVAIVKYSSTATLVQGLTPVSGQANLISLIQNLNANGNTNIQDGIIKADNELTLHGTFNCNTDRSIVLLTDGVANRTGNNNSCSGGINGSCVQSAITAANNAKTTIVSGVTYNNQIFSIGLFGGISGSDQNIAEYTLNNIQSSGAYFTESGANLSGIYSQIFSQLSWVASQLSNIPFVTETINNNFDLVPSSINVSKGTYSLSGETISWNVPFLNVETITLHYQLTPKPNVCSNQNVSNSRMDFLNSQCNADYQNITTPNYCVPCPPIITKGSIASCYNFISEAETAAILATSSSNNCSSSLTTTASTIGTCNAEITVTVTNGCGQSNSVVYYTKIDSTPPTINQLPLDTTVNCYDDVVFTEATASDNCDSNFDLTYQDVTIIGNCPNSYSVTRTWTATDGCGNSSTASQTINIQDTTAPTIDILASDLTVECDGNGNTADLQAWLTSNGGASASDSCSSVTWSNDYSALSDDCGATGSVTVTFTATDDCGNSSTSSATFTIQDTTAPTIAIAAADLTVECDGNGNTADLQAWLAANGGASSSDACSNVTWSNNYSSLSDDCGATGSVSVTFTATDDCGNSSSSSATFTIQDTTAPTIDILASDLTVECDGNGNTADLQAWLASNGGASSSDNCSSVTWSNDYSALSDDCGATGSVSVTFTATDDCGNSSSSSATFTIQDTTAPTIDIAASDLTVECDGNGNTADLQAWLAANGGASSTDACSSVTWTNDYSSVVGSCGATGSVTVTFTATDDCGNSSSSSATFTIQDTTAPTIDILASDLTVECDGNGNTADLQAWLASNGGASSSDACSNVTWSNDYSALSDDCGATGSVTVTFTATDDCGNSASSSATFTIQDTTAPTIDIVASDLTVECDGNGNTADLQAWLTANGGASSSDACSSVTWSNNYASLSDDCGATGSVSVTFTATDDCGNSSTSSATFTIQDTTAPTIAIAAADLTVECDGNGNTADLQAWLAANGGASSSDACSSVTWSNNYSSLSDDCGATGSVSVTFTATDDCGNSSTSSATFTIQDTTAPTIAIAAADLTVECDGNGNTADLQAWLAANGGASSSDACSSVTWSNNYSSLSDDCGATGSVSVTFTATDDCGNSSTSSATFTIQDTTAPTIAIAAADLTVECDGNGNTADLQAWLASNGGATSSDACSSVTWSNNYASLSDDCGATGSVSVTFTATDDCGNSSTSSATFTIQDTTAPTIAIAAADLTVECDGNGNTADLQAWLAANGGASSSDACSNVTWSNDYSALSDDCGATGSVTVTFTATDDCGNSASSSATFTIVDTTAPTINIVAADLTVECDGNGNTADLQAWLASNGGASASDSCSSVTWSNDYSALSDDCGATGSVSVTFTAKDDCGNSSSSSATFTIVDTTAPTIDIVAADVTVECDGNGNTADLQAWLASNGGASSSDSCSSVTWSNDYSALSDDCGATGSVTVTFTATDDCGNSSTSSATFTIQDTTAPTIDIVASDLTVECDGNGNTADLQAWLASNGGASSTDACSSVTWTNDYSSVVGSCGATGSVTVTFNATDDCGNSSSSSATFTIVDTTAPTIDIVAADLTVECDGNGNTADLQAWLATNGGASSSDSCSSVTWSNDYSALSDDCGATGSVSVTFTATDDCGNSSTSSATFTIQDTTAPTIDIVAADVTVECDGNGNTADLQAWLSSNGGASSSDACSSVTWSNNYSSLSDDCGATGSVSVTFTATDDCGNSSSSSATFTIQDTTAPTIAIAAADLTVECDGYGNAADLQAWLASNGGASSSDACSSVTWSNDYSALSDDCGATGSITVTFTATDDCGNSSTSSATFTIEDTTAPTIDILASDLTVECDGNGNAADLQTWLAANGGASASDSCSSVTWSNDYSALSDDCGATGSVTVTFTATDDCGNSSTSSATFTIQDTTNPEFTSNLPSDISVSCDNIPSPEELKASDNCSSITTVLVEDENITDESACAGEYIILRTWTATDDCGNFITYSQTINVYDNTAPVLDTPYDEQIEVSCTEIPDVPQLEFSDNCSGIASVDYNENTTTISIYEYYIEREWLVSDNCGNVATFNQTIHVNVDQPFNAIPYSICTDEEPINLFTILDGSLPTNGEWIEVTNSGGLNGNMFNPSGVATGYYTIQYIVTLENNTCPSKFEIYLNVNDDCVVLPACDIVIYNAVSPNNDGSNDMFIIDGIECYPNNTVEIYNRWGILVYETKGYDNLIRSFKGYSEGRTTLNKNELLPDGTYFYILNYKDEEGKTHDKSGYLYLNK